MRGKKMKLSHRKAVRQLLDLDRSKSSLLNRKLKGQPSIAVRQNLEEELSERANGIGTIGLRR